MTVSSDIADRLICWNASVLPGVLRWAVGIALAGGIAVQAAAGADQRSGPADPARPMLFDLRAQPLGAALESYSIVSGWQVLYNGRLDSGRRSSDVKGEFTPGVALRMLLAGTGLMPQYRAADGAILVPDPMATLAPDEIADDVPPSLKAYYGLIQTRLKRAFCASPRIRTGAYRVALGFWVGSSGNVTRMVLLSSSGRADVDESFNRAVGSLSLGTPVPAGFAQPVVLLVTPELVGRCAAAPGTSSVGAPQ